MTLSPATRSGSARPSRPGSHLEEWVAQWAALFEPETIVWCDGSLAQRHQLISQLVEAGTLEALNPDLRPYSFVARSSHDDVARVESRTFVCSKDPDDAGPTNNWAHPATMRKTLKGLFAGSMRGRTLYAVPFSMGPSGSAVEQFGIQLTDSPYVALSLTMMVRVSPQVRDLIEAGASWVKCVHSVGAPLASGQADLPWPCHNTKYISHFPQTREVWSFGSAYGGNAILPKKSFALRIASVIAREEGWLAEHMVIVRVTNPEGRVYHFAAAFPSACGKTNFAMMQPALPGWRVETLGDDIAWLHVSSDGRLRAINPEAGFFGVAPGTSRKTNPVALDTVWGHTVFTNVATTADGDVWWEGLTRHTPEGLTNWRGEAHDPTSGLPAAHPNGRFTVALEQCPTLAEDWDDPAGVPIDGIIFGGRRADTIPLVAEARDWTHGVFLGATMASEQTAAADGQVGQIRRDPFAMVPFAGYHIADYINHWLGVGERLRRLGRTPRVFQVNWFQRDDSGEFIWPGFGENIRVVKWMIDRIEGRVAATETPLGLTPRSEDLDASQLDLEASRLQRILEVDSERARAEIHAQKEYLESLGPKLAQELKAVVGGDAL